MKVAQQFLQNLLHDESGQDLIEYALIAGIIALGAVASAQTLANQIGNEFNAIGSSL